MSSSAKHLLVVLAALAAAVVVGLLLHASDEGGRAAPPVSAGDASATPAAPAPTPAAPEPSGPHLQGKAPPAPGGGFDGPGGKGLVGSREPAGPDLSDPAVRAAELRRLMGQQPVDWGKVAKVVALMNEPLPASMRPVMLQELRSGRRLQVMRVFDALHDGSYVADLFALLDDPSVTAGARGAVLEALWRMPGGDRDDVVRRLEGRLQGEPAKDGALLQALSRRGGPEAARAWVDYLRRVQRPGEVPRYLLQMVDVKDPAAAKVLARALRTEGSPQVQAKLVEMATRPGATALVQPLLELDHEGVDDTVRAKALMALGRIGAPTGVQYLLLRADEGGTYGAKAIQAIAQIRSQDPKVTAQLAAALAQVDTNPRPAAARKSLLLAIGASRDPRALPAVAATLDDADEGVRLAAVQAMERMGPKARSYVGRLSNLFDSGNARTRLRVAAALGNIGGQEAVDAMQKMLTRKGLSPSLRQTLKLGLDYARKRLAAAPK
jgi:hypothetical protein